MASQKCCIFVGNIPYDVGEEEVMRICEEIGPVVSFNLVTHKETGKPKGYGFCEYKDEETALSARRNLQGYHINGRQLRVDFAAEQRDHPRGRGPQKSAGNASDHKQQIGIDAAVMGASVMARALGGAITSNPNTNVKQPVIVAGGADPLTLHLARMSRNHLTQVLHQLNEMVTVNSNVARELLLSNPHLSKALLQVMIMLGMVPQQTLSNIIKQVSFSVSQNNAGPQQQLVSPQPQFVMQAGEGPSSVAAAHVPLLPCQSYTSHFQLPQQTQRPAPTQVTKYMMHSQQFLASSSVTAQHHIAVAPSPTTHQMPLHEQIGSSQLGPQSHSVNLHTSFYPHPPVVGYQLGSMSQGTLQLANRRQEDGSCVPGPALQELGRPLKRVKMEELTNFPPSGAASISANQNIGSGVEPIEEQNLQLPPGMDPGILELVLKITPQQLSLLPHDQQQQVIQLQKMLTNSAPKHT